MEIFRFLLFVFLGFFYVSYISNSQKCKDFLIFDGSEQVIEYDIDTTGNWWILTRPYSDEFRLILPNSTTATFKEIKNLSFSPDGSRWAFFGRNNSGWNLVTSDTTIPLFCENVVDIGFSQNSEGFFYAYKNGMQTTVNFNHKQATLINYEGKILLNFDGTLIAFVLTKGRSKTLVVPSRFESENFDEIIPLGFWADDEFIYAGRRGNLWQIFKNQKAITEDLLGIIDMKINWNGTNAAFAVRRNINESVTIIFSENYSELVYSKSYESIQQLKLHPTEPMTLFVGKRGENKYIVYGNVEYPIGNFETSPNFTFDGSEIYYCFCDIECYFYVDGKRNTLPGGITCAQEKDVARKPKTTTIAYTNYTNLVLLDFFTNIQYSGMMVDKGTKAMYNWKSGRYEALGEINNKIYLLTCRP
jgi:hypothetical protein